MEIWSSGKVGINVYLILMSGYEFDEKIGCHLPNMPPTPPNKNRHNTTLQDVWLGMVKFKENYISKWILFVCLFHKLEIKNFAQFFPILNLVQKCVIAKFLFISITIARGKSSS